MPSKTLGQWFIAFATLVAPLSLPHQARADVAGYQFTELYRIGDSRIGTGFGYPPPPGQFGSQITFSVLDANNYEHGWIFDQPFADGMELTAPGEASVHVGATDGIHQVGFAWNGQIGSSANPLAIVWQGSSASAVDINPQGYSISHAYGVRGSQVVGQGYGYRNGVDHVDALLWNINTNQVVDLQPYNPNLPNSIAYGTDGVHQVGALTAPTGTEYAAMWSGTAQSAVQLSTIQNSYALGVGGNEQVGFAEEFTNHAMLWRGSQQSQIDLQPSWFTYNEVTTAFATNGINQVGFGGNIGPSNQTHAMVWSGIADSAIDLNPTGMAIDSEAYYIDDAGNIFGQVWTGTTAYAAEWSPTPEPSAWLLLLGCGAVLLIAKRPRRLETESGHE